MMTMKIKEWKVDQIIRDMSKYGDKYYVNVPGHEPFHNMHEYTDDEGFLTVANIVEVVRETEKAMMLNIDGFKTWVPKSCLA